MKIFYKILILEILVIQIFSLICFAKTNTILEDKTNETEEINKLTDLELDSNSVILLEEKTGFVIYEKNSEEKLYPASTTKIMTAILVLENCNLEDVVTVSENSLKNIPNGYVTGEILAGEQICINDLLYTLMLKSANDVAVVLADYVSSSVENFAKLMNEKALEIGCKNTNFVNPNGIHDENHYTTASDLALIAKYCMKNETFRKIVSTPEYTLPATNKYAYENRTFKNTNELILHDSSYYYDYATGIKTGYTKEAGSCLISSSSKNGINFICVVLGGKATNSRFKDTVKLFDYGYENFSFIEIKKENEVVYNLEIPNATDETKNLNLKIENSLITFGNKNFNYENLEPKIELKNNIKAPIEKNEVLGTITYTVNDTEYSSNLLASFEVVPKTNYLLLIIIGILLLAFGLKILKPKKRKKKSKKKNKR